MTPLFRSICLLIIYSLLSSGDIQQRCRPCIDAHELPLRLPVCLTHGHQEVHSLSDLLKIRGSEGILVQMIQDAAVSVFQRRRYGRLKEIG